MVLDAAARVTAGPSCPAGSVAPVRTMFVLYLVLIVAGIALYTVIGLSHY